MTGRVGSIGMAYVDDTPDVVDPDVEGLELDIDWRNRTDWPEGWSGGTVAVGPVPTGSDTSMYFAPEGLAFSFGSSTRRLTGSGAIPQTNYMTFAVKMKGLYFGSSNTFESYAGFAWRRRTTPTTSFVYQLYGGATLPAGTGSNKYQTVHRSSANNLTWNLNNTTADQWLYAAIVVHRTNFMIYGVNDSMVRLVQNYGPNFTDWGELDETLNMHVETSTAEGINIVLKAAVIERSVLYRQRALRFMEIVRLFEKWGHPGLTDHDVYHP